MNKIAGWLCDRFQDVTPEFFYRTIFPEGELEEKGKYERGKYNGIIVAVTDKKKYNGKTLVKRYTLNNGLETLKAAVESDDFCLCSPLSYAGKNRTMENARMLYAIAVDVDRIRKSEEGEPVGLRDLWHQVNTINKYTKEMYLPTPTFIVSSGTGVHLYFVLETPIPLYRNYAFELQELKRALTKLIWNDYVVDIHDPRDIQQEGIYQGFRMPGTITKNGGRAIAFLTGKKVSIDYLNRFVPAADKAKDAEKIKKRGSLSLEEAKALYPDWYERRIIRKEPPGKWTVNRNLYEWWKRKIYEGATVGHRYYCIMTLAIIAKKCSYYNEKRNPNPVTEEELVKDAYSFIDFLDSKTDDENNHFDAGDVQDALEAYQDKFVRYPRIAAEYRTGIDMPPQKRNWQNQAEHLEEARAIRDIRCQRRGEAWNSHSGRKSKFDAVKQWKEEHPQGTPLECAADTGIGKSSVYRHWNSEKKPERAAASSPIGAIEKDIKENIKKAQESAAALRKLLASVEGADTERVLSSEEQKALNDAADVISLLDKLTKVEENKN